MPIRHIAELNPYDTNRHFATGVDKEPLVRRPEDMSPEGPHAKPRFHRRGKNPRLRGVPGKGQPRRYGPDRVGMAEAICATVVQDMD